jgi:hypothetical protein
MFDLLAAIQAADPMAIPLLAVLAFAAGMYPIGIMLGSPCSPCCAPCGCESGATLPEYITATFSGLTNVSTGLTSEPHLAFESDFGSGAAGTITAPGAPGGPITSVTLTSGGSGYALLGRVAPAITASPSQEAGSGAELAVTLAATTHDGKNVWEVSKVTVASAGDGYIDGQSVEFSVASGDTVEVGAVATLAAQRSEPTLRVYKPGNPAEFIISYSKISTTPDSWGISSVTADGEATDFIDGESLTISLEEENQQLEQADLSVATVLVEPTISASVDSSTGSGATLSVSLTESTLDGRPIWSVSSVTVTNGGSGYEASDGVLFSIDDGGYKLYVASATIAVSDGEVTGVSVDFGGYYFKDSGEVESVNVNLPGSYYRRGGVLSVAVSNGGRYYREDAAAPPIVAEVTVTVLVGGGSGAVIEATVDDDTSSPTFGQIISLTLVNGGSGYSNPYAECKNCHDKLNGHTALLYLGPGCTYYGHCCNLGGFTVEYRGTQRTPFAMINGCDTEFIVDEEDGPFLCDSLSFTGTSVHGGTISVSPYTGDEEPAADDYPCPPCCTSSSFSAPVLNASGSYPCNKEECLSLGSSWLERCECGRVPGTGGCVNCDTTQTLIVTAQSNTGGDYTLTLNAANNWTDVAPGPPGSFPWTSGARAHLDRDEAAGACNVRVFATEGYCSYPGSPVPSYINLGYWKPYAIPVPFREGCITGGSSLSCSECWNPPDPDAPCPQRTPSAPYYNYQLIAPANPAVWTANITITLAT